MNNYKITALGCILSLSACTVSLVQWEHLFTEYLADDGSVSTLHLEDGRTVSVLDDYTPANTTPDRPGDRIEVRDAQGNSLFEQPLPAAVSFNPYTDDLVQLSEHAALVQNCNINAPSAYTFDLQTGALNEHVFTLNGVQVVPCIIDQERLESGNLQILASIYHINNSAPQRALAQLNSQGELEQVIPLNVNDITSDAYASALFVERQNIIGVLVNKYIAQEWRTEHTLLRFSRSGELLTRTVLPSDKLALNDDDSYIVLTNTELSRYVPASDSWVGIHTFARTSAQTMLQKSPSGGVYVAKFPYHSESGTTELIRIDTNGLLAWAKQIPLTYVKEGEVEFPRMSFSQEGNIALSYGVDTVSAGGLVSIKWEETYNLYPVDILRETYYFQFLDADGNLSKSTSLTPTVISAPYSLDGNAKYYLDTYATCKSGYVVTDIKYFNEKMLNLSVEKNCSMPEWQVTPGIMQLALP